MPESPDPAAAERADVALLQQIWGMDEPDARELLRAAGMDVELAVDAWRVAGEKLTKTPSPSDELPGVGRLAIAVRYAGDRR